jgi:tRNA U34 5-methylaminomethyl-2-thiouridine-forming methyltransferase MnmC
LNREIIHTLDGSTIQIKEWDECYHSKHGAIQEAQHVFYKKWIVFILKTTNIQYKIGFGTGLNAFITFLEGTK